MDSRPQTTASAYPQADVAFWGWVIERTVQNVERAMQVECPRDSDGNPLGNYQYNGAVANRGLELAARILGMLVDRSEVRHKKDYEQLSNLELLQLLAVAFSLDDKKLYVSNHPVSAIRGRVAGGRFGVDAAGQALHRCQRSGR